MAGTLRWVSQNGFDLFSSIGIIATLLFTGASYRVDTRSRRLSNLISLTQQHRAIWDDFIQKKELSRVLDPEADLKSRPVTSQEAQFIVLLILHLHCWFRAVQIREVKEADGLSRDIRAFFALPIPKGVWAERRAFYDSDFVLFVERSAGMI